MGIRHSRRTRVVDNVYDTDIIVLTAIDASLQDAPLPDGWEKNVCPKGNVYFVDHLNKRTTFDDPRITDGRKQSRRSIKPPSYEWNFYSKCQHFRALLRRKVSDEGQVTVITKRENLFEDSFNLINNLDNETLTRRLFIKFEGEKGLDYGGMSREWFLLLSEEILDPSLNLFKSVGYEYTINPESKNNPKCLDYFKFIGKVMGMAIYHGKLFHSYFILPFYKLLLNEKLEFDDMKSYDPQIWKSMNYIKQNKITEDFGLTFTMNMESKDENGTIMYNSIELKKNGSNIPLTDDNKKEYLDLVFKHYLNSTKGQIKAIQEGLQLFVPIDTLKEFFQPEEIQLVLGGISEIDIKDMESNAEYQGGYTSSSVCIKWFWEIIRSMSQDDLKLFLLFVTGTNKVPIGGFAHLYGSNGPQKLTINKISTKSLPSSHSCFNRLDMPEYKSKDILSQKLYYAIKETKGFDLE